MNAVASGARIQAYRILNPDFGKISLGKPRLFKADPRLGPVASP
jgi:hypothetical protein